jgi:hypothetical protein
VEALQRERVAAPLVRGPRVSEPGGSLLAALAWGAVWAGLGVLTLSLLLASSGWPIAGSRAMELRNSLHVMEHGGPLLLGYTPGTHKPFAIGYADDEGIYVILPLLSRWLGQTNPLAVEGVLWRAAWALTLLFSPVVFGRLFRSRWAAILAPPALLVCICSFGYGDVYWVSAWVAVTLMPLLVLIARSCARWAAAMLVPIALVAGVATTIRGEAGLGVVLAACGMTLFRASWRLPLRAAVVAAIALAYAAPLYVVLPTIRAHRDHQIGVDLIANAPTSHPLWHTVYIGLGYTPNRYGIHYSDVYAAAAAQEAQPGVPYLSERYAGVLHKQVDALIADDPWFVAKAEAQKAVIELTHVSRYLLLLALLLPAALTAEGAARLRPWELAMFAPALAIGALPGIIATPGRFYEMGLLGPLGGLGMLAIGSLGARAEHAWRGQRDATGGLIGRTRWALRGLWATLPRGLTLRVMGATVALIVCAVLFADRLEAEHKSWDRSVSSTPKVVLAEGPSAHGRLAVNTNGRDGVSALGQRRLN